MVDVVFGLEEFGVVQLDRDFVPGEDTRHRHLKEVGAVLLEEGGGLAFVLSLLEGFLGLLFFLNLGGDGAVADGHGHAVDGSSGRGGEEVSGIKCLPAFVSEGLGEGDLGEGAGDGDLSVGRLQGEKLLLRVVGASGDLEIGKKRGLVGEADGVSKEENEQGRDGGSYRHDDQTVPLLYEGLMKRV